MSETIQITDGLAARLRAALGSWASRLTRHPVADFASQITIDSVRDYTAYAAFLNCLVDARTAPVDREIPYRPDALPPVADRNDLWSLPVRLKKQFHDQEETVVAADSLEPVACNRCAGGALSEPCVTCSDSKVAPCTACTGKGRKSCTHCHGEGKTSCGLCAGSGKVVASVDSNGIPSLGVCSQCMGKKEFPCHDCRSAPLSDCRVCSNRRTVACGPCEGRGTKLCSHCGGAGSFVKGYSTHIAYKVAYHRSMIREANIPEEVFPEDPPTGKLGETVFEAEEAEGAFGTSVLDGAAGKVYANVLAQVPTARVGEPSKLILQSVKIERVPIYLVTYGYEGRPHCAWVSHYENRVLPLDDPFTKHREMLVKQSAQREEAQRRDTRVALLSGAIVSGVSAVLIPLIWEFVQTSPNRHWPLAILGILILMGGLCAIWLLRGRALPSSAVAAAAVVLIMTAFAIASPIHRLDVREFNEKFSVTQNKPFPQWGQDDAASLAQLIKEFSARGVDTSAAQSQQEEYESYLAAVRVQAAREAQARREAAARRKAELARQEADRKAKALAARKRALAKPPAKKAKKRRWFQIL